MKIKYLLVFFLFLAQLKLIGQEALFYNLDIHINVKTKTLNVDGYIDINFDSEDSLNFILWKYSVIKEIKINHNPCDFLFDTISPSPSFFVPHGKTLTIKRPNDASETNQRIHVNYSSDMSELGQNWEGSFTDEWIELAMYSGWYPSLNGIYSAKLNIYIDDEYEVTGSGSTSKKEGYWELNKNWRSFDLVLMASRNLKTKVYTEGNSKIQIDYTNLSEAGSDSALIDCISAFNSFKDKYGTTEGQNLKIVIGPERPGGGYSRKNFITMPANEYSLILSYGNAHEIAHFWWSQASTNSWEDWLNEAFAEYSALIFIRDRFGKEAFNNRIKEYQKETVHTSPIWGLDRFSQEAYYTLYFKGSLILYDLEQKLGTEQFFALLNKISAKAIATTDDLLSLIREQVSEDTSSWLEKELKTR